MLFSDVISKFFGRHVISNENNIYNIIDRFCSSLKNTISIICHERHSIDNVNHLNTDCLKSLRIDRFCTIALKFVNIRSISSISNFIFVSNNQIPIKIENSDRRYFVFKCSDDVKGNFSYFANLNDQFDELFYRRLFCYP
jgi:hypothetical protein